MTGADRYTDALALLRELHAKPDVSDTTKALLIAEAQVHATLSNAAAQALSVVTPLVGDSPEVTEWARLVASGALAGGYRIKAEEFLPEHWPPEPGDIWQDRDGNRWACLHDKTLAAIAFQADDVADEIRRVYGEMTFVYRAGSREEECPF